MPIRSPLFVASCALAASSIAPTPAGKAGKSVSLNRAIIRQGTVVPSQPASTGESVRQGNVVPSRPAQSRTSAFRQGTEAKYKAEHLAHYLRVLERKLRVEVRAIHKCCNDEECALDMCDTMADLLDHEQQSLRRRLDDPEGDMRSRQRAVIQSSAVAAQYRQVKARYELQVESCHDHRVQHESLISLLEEQKREVIRRLRAQ